MKRTMGFFAFCYCLPWLLVFGVGYVLSHPVPVLLGLGIFLVVVFGIAKVRTDRMLADAWALTRARQQEDLVRKAEAVRGRTAADETAPDQAAPSFEQPFPAQYTSFAFRYGLPPTALGRKKALPPPAPTDG